MIDAAKDIKLFFDPNITGDFADAQIKYEGDFERDQGLGTAIIISLFTDMKVSQEEAIDGYRGGHFGNDLLGYNLGSRLFLLKRKKLVKDTFRLAEQYSVEALDWMKKEGIVSTIIAIAIVSTIIAIAGKSKTRKNALLLLIQIKKPDNVVLNYKFVIPWEKTLEG
jgi:phage gp46-like protein